MTGPPTGPPSFSDRHRQIIERVCRNMSYLEIGTELSISPHTVRAHVVQIAQKIPDFPDLPPRWRILAYIRWLEYDASRKAS